VSKIIHIIGTGTIGEPLIGLFADDKEAFGIEEVTFHKRTPMIEERGKVADLERRGAVLVVDSDRRRSFEELGHRPKYEAREAIERATVVIDCTPAGNENKQEYYVKAKGPRGFMAQGSEYGFGKPYARGVNDEALISGEDRYLQIVSCNTHNIAVLVKTLAMDEDEDGTNHLESGRFLCLRRSNDISQDSGFIASPQVGKHDDPRFGTHHARDAHELFGTLGHDLPLWSSALKVNSQYMHAVWFSLLLDRPITLDEVQERLEANPRVAITYKRSANQIFSFGRDHGYFGRILSQAVVPMQTLALREEREVVGFCFTPQDGNPLLSSVAATLWYLHPEGFGDRLEVLRRYLFQEV
jgi:glyceraldehyde-3-phosphate dehydrogenase/erythrose-4-phosphate dehydrogenase